mmetsp:Transcript_19519/g.74902  ORF Transcript_19519/g.74902 Transcript_19519/m.74902 type:complete len:251 (+) Transcript_19519:732-1484(+)
MAVAVRSQSSPCCGAALQQWMGARAPSNRPSTACSTPRRLGGLACPCGWSCAQLPRSTRSYWAESCRILTPRTLRSCRRISIRWPVPSSKKEMPSRLLRHVRSRRGSSRPWNSTSVCRLARWPLCSTFLYPAAKQRSLHRRTTGHQRWQASELSSLNWGCHRARWAQTSCRRLALSPRAASLHPAHEAPRWCGEEDAATTPKLHRDSRRRAHRTKVGPQRSEASRSRSLGLTDSLMRRGADDGDGRQRSA